MKAIRLLPLLAVAVLAAAQTPASGPAVWQIQESGTTAGLRGIDSVDGTVAWASGTGGTILRTIDGGAHWTKCAVPNAAKDGATLDFRGVQAWDAETAIVMASGPGEKSRLYKTTDGCKAWKLVFTNPDKDGFWDAVKFDDRIYGMILGDPVGGFFATFITLDGGTHWRRQQSHGLETHNSQEAIFAASNDSLIMFTLLAHRFFVTGGPSGAYFIQCHGELFVGGKPENVDCGRNPERLPLAYGTARSGAFSLGMTPDVLIAVGGDYRKPDENSGTAAWSADVGLTWTASTTPPHGFRSAVQWSDVLKAWITVGTNGSDVSRDDGKTWQPLDDGNWNALSLPFVVGPNGRIARINAAAIPEGVTKATQPSAESTPSTVK
jgi:photosystem II stability/assembly factor-like uncharacterized protein